MKKLNFIFSILIFWLVLNTCRVSHQLKTENRNDCNFYFYIKDEIFKELGNFNKLKIKFILNKKDYTDFVLINLHRNVQSTCFQLHPGLNKLEIMLSYSKYISWDGNHKYLLSDIDRITNSLYLLFFVDHSKIYYLAPIPGKEKKLNLWENFINIYKFLLFPLGYFPYYESNLSLNINEIPESLSESNFSECKIPEENKVCSQFFEKLILETSKE